MATGHLECGSGYGDGAPAALKALRQATLSDAVAPAASPASLQFSGLSDPHWLLLTRPCTVATA